MIFNSTEREGVLVMLLLITGLIVIPRFVRSGKPAFFLLPEVINIEKDSLRPVSHREISPPLELNTADSSALVRIRGIGPYYASKIIKYRQRLGGFYAVRQLKELKMNHFNVDSCAGVFTVDPSKIVKYRLDTMSFKAILRHPYLEYEDVQMIFNAKRKYDSLSFQLLEEKKVLPAYKLKKIEPYFQ